MNYFCLQDLISNRKPERKHCVKICLEKPTAVTFADAPAVEFTLDGDFRPLPSSSDISQVSYKRPPFPLQGRLDVWIRENFPDV